MTSPSRQLSIPTRATLNPTCLNSSSMWETVDKTNSTTSTDLVSSWRHSASSVTTTTSMIMLLMSSELLLDKVRCLVTLCSLAFNFEIVRFSSIPRYSENM